MTLSRLPCPDCDGSGYDVEPECCGNTTSSGECRGDCAVPSQVPCRSCGGAGELSCVDDDPSVEAELSSGPPRVPSDTEEFAEWARQKLDPFEQAGADPPP